MAFQDDAQQPFDDRVVVDAQMHASLNVDRVPLANAAYSSNPALAMMAKHNRSRPRLTIVCERYLRRKIDVTRSGLEPSETEPLDALRPCFKV